MSCEICGNAVCRSEFHTIQEQAEFELWNSQSKAQKYSQHCDLLARAEGAEQEIERLNEKLTEIERLLR